MALLIPVSNSPSSEQLVSLNNRVVSMDFKFNAVNQSWYMDLRDSSGKDIKLGIRVMANQNLTLRFNLVEIPSGDLWCLKQKSTNQPLGRENFGKNKDYRLFYILRSEAATVGVENVIQL